MKILRKFMLLTIIATILSSCNSADKDSKEKESITTVASLERNVLPEQQ